MTTETKSKLDYEPSHMMDGQYAILMETSGEESESWYSFIRVNGNEDNLKFLQEQLEKVEWYILDDLSTFDLDMDHFVSAQTAKELTKVDLNHTSFHRKFDGILKRIDFRFKKKMGNETKICVVNDKINFGKIEDYIDDEDLDEEDLVSSSDTENESVEDSDDDKSRNKDDRDDRDDRDDYSDSTSVDDTESDEEDTDGKEDEKKEVKPEVKVRIPGSLKK